MARSELCPEDIYSLEYLIMTLQTMPSQSSFRLSLPTLVIALGICAEIVACGSGGENNAGQVGSQPPPPPAKVQYAYVASEGDNQIYTYAVNQDGSLASTGSVAAGDAPRQIAFHPSHLFAYVVNNLSHNISMYNVNPANGALTQLKINGVQQPPLPVFTNLASIVVERTGHFAYTANEAAASVSTFSIDPTTGALTFVETVPVGIPSLSTETFSVAVDPSRDFLYATGGCDKYLPSPPNPPNTLCTGNAIHAFSIDPTSGKLTSLGTAPAPPIAVHVSVHPTKPFAYLASGIDHMVTTYNVSGPPAKIQSLDTGGTAARAVVIEPSGRFAYVADVGQHQIAAYSISQTNGELTPLTPPIYSLPTDGGRFLTIDSSGQFLYVTSNASSSTVAVLHIDSSNGSLTPLPAYTVLAGSGSIGITTNNMP